MNTATFLTQVRQVVQLNDTAEDWDDAAILREATNALYERFTQAVANLRHGYWLHRTTFQTQAGIAKYRIPPRAIVQGLEKFEMTTGDGQSWRQLAILTNSQASDYDVTNQRSTPSRFELEGDSVRVYPTPNAAVTMRMTFYLRPSVLIVPYAADNAGVITAITPTTITLAAPLDDMVESVTDVIDTLHTTGCNEVTHIDAPVTVSDAGLTLTGTFSDELIAQTVLDSDVVRLADQTDYVPLPIELHQALVSFVAATILADKGDGEKASMFTKKADSAIARIIDIAEPRIKSKPYSFVTRNTYLRRRASFGYWR